MSMKKIVGLLLVVLLCQAEIIDAPAEQIHYEDLDLSANDQGQFAADLADDQQSLGLSDQFFNKGPWKGKWGNYGDAHSSEVIHGGHKVVRYLTNSITTNPQVVVFDNSNFYLGGYPSIRRGCRYNRQNYRFNWNGNWQGRLNGLSHHARGIVNTWESVVRIQYYNNFWRCYNRLNQVVIVFQRITHPFIRSSSWQVPAYPVDFSQYPAYNPYTSLSNQWAGTVGSSQHD